MRFAISTAAEKNDGELIATQLICGTSLKMMC